MKLTRRKFVNALGLGLAAIASWSAWLPRPKRWQTVLDTRPFVMGVDVARDAGQSFGVIAYERDGVVTVIGTIEESSFDLEKGVYRLTREQLDRLQQCNDGGDGALTFTYELTKPSLPYGTMTIEPMEVES